MTNAHDSEARANSLVDLIRNARLVWRLLNDGRVSPWLKLIPALTLLYLISPIDLLPDFLVGPGQLDDLGVILLGLWLFLVLAPRDLVQEHTGAGHQPPVDVTYRVVHDEPDHAAPPDRRALPSPDDADARPKEP